MHNPYAVKLELVRGCTARCPFCALRHMKWAEQEYSYMTSNLFMQIMLDLHTWLPKFRLEFANRGEPTLHPQLMELTSMARIINKQCQILLTSNTDLAEKNGYDWYVDMLKSFYSLGGNIVLLDCYVPNRYQRVLDAVAHSSLHNYTEYFFGEKEFNPYNYRSPNFKALCIKDAAVYEGKTKENKILYYHNQGGNARVEGKALEIWSIEQPAEPLKLMCVRPFRELTIHYDGTVPICCDDWKEQAVIGRFPEQSLEDIWLHTSEMNSRRLQLIAKNRELSPCNKCSVHSGSRPGLEMGWFKEKRT